MELLQMDNQETHQNNSAYVVGIGASAGGLNALELFFRNMPCDSGLAFVVIQHLSPDYKSCMDELLTRHTRMSVHVVTDGIELQSNCIYLIPPKTDMRIKSEKIYLNNRVAGEDVDLPIDTFFHALAEDLGGRAIGIILSGSGSDGSRGIHSIKKYNGLVIAQTPESAQFDSMPRNAIASGVSDHILSPDRMPSLLLEYLLFAKTSHNDINHISEVMVNNEGYANIIALILSSYNLDFSKYKVASLRRRIARRMELHNIANVAEYSVLVSGNQGELDLLYNDLLIGVTEFFRDKKAFQFLEQTVIPQLFANVQSGEGLRVWSAACATGEEVYSLAILLLEEAERINFTGKITVFATDIHTTSLEVAAQGVYCRDRLANVSPERIERFFKKDKDDHHRVTTELRNIVVFAPHNLLNDPPFTRIDFVCCRNLLIYLLLDVQEKVISLFHFALKKSGILFLGSSESLGTYSGEFIAINNQFKVFRKLRDLKLAIDLNSIHPLQEKNILLPLRQPAVLRQSTLDLNVLNVYDQLLQKHLPSGVLIDDRHQIIHYFGNGAEYLKMPEGRVETNILALAEENLHIVLSRAISTSDKTKQCVVTRNVHVKRRNEDVLIDVTVDPLPDDKCRRTHYHIYFGQIRPCEPLQNHLELDATGFDLISQYRQYVNELESELRSSRTSLRKSIEEVLASNEKLQTANKELLTTNEELQNTNEELHTVNEELYSVNAEFERKNQELQHLTTDYNNLLSSTDIGTIFLDRNMLIRSYNAAIVTCFNLLPQDIGRPIEHIAYRLSNQSEMLADIKNVLDGGKPIESERITRDGKCLLERVMPFKTESDHIEGVVISFTDITHIKHILEQKQLLAKVFEHSAEALIITDAENKIIAVNSSFTRLTGYTQDDVLGKDPKILNSGRESAEFYADMWESLLTHDRWHGELWDKCKDGSFYPKWLSICVIRNEQGKIANYIAGFSDISERKQAEQEIKYLAHHDSLTNLPNRFSLGERLSQSLEQAKRAGHHMAVLFLDLDRFKNINDSLGHHIGDMLLFVVAARLQASVRKSDIVARLGGDEFVIVLPEIQSGIASVNFVDKIRSALSQPYLIDSNELFCTSSIGISVFPHDGDTVEELMKNADTAMYHAKSQGRNNYQFFKHEMHATAHEKLILENELQLAVERHELFLYYQPQIETASGKIVGVEALVRWKHAERGFIPPAIFIPIAEESGLIIKMGAQILETACSQLAAWMKEGVPPLRMAVNLSAKQFRQKKLPDLVADIIAKTGIDARLLELEITETAAMEYPEDTIFQIERLKEMKVQLAIDDFGTGYSSLGNLRLFNVNRLKIDRSFVKDIETNNDDATIAEAIISLAHTLNKEVIAEGVENEAQFQFLSSQQCNSMQGFFFSQPLPADVAAEFIKNNRASQLI